MTNQKDSKSWKGRFEYPAIAQLEGYNFDIERLKKDYLELSTSKQFNGLMAEYNGLCESHKKLPDFFLERGELPDENANYSQLALSKWDPLFSLEMRGEKSNTRWDKACPRGTSRADERFYRAPVEGIPSYLSSVLDTFRPALHRCRFAKLNAGGRVLPHIDYNTTYGIRLHIAITTNDSCTNGAELKDGKSLVNHIPADGTVWFVNQGVRHWAKNEGETERVHLILSIDSQSFIDKLAL